MDALPAAAERTSRALDDLLREEGRRLRAGFDRERAVLREALLRAARAAVDAGDDAAAVVVSRSVDLAAGYLSRGQVGRAATVDLSSRLAHDRVRAAAQNLADEIRALEGDLAGPLIRLSRAAASTGLPEIRRIAADSVNSAREALGPTPDAASLAELDRDAQAFVAEARRTAKDLVDGALERIHRAGARSVAVVESAVEALPQRVRAAAERDVEPALVGLADEVGEPRRGFVWSSLVFLGSGMAILVVVVSTLVSYAVGLAAAGALFGAIVLTGTYAPPVGAGFVAAGVGTFLAAAFTDLWFNVLGEWRSGRDDGLLGAMVPVRSSGRLPRGVELAGVLDALHLKLPRAPQETPAPAAYAPFDLTAPTGADPTSDGGLVDADAHRRTMDGLRADLVRDVTTDERAGDARGRDERSEE